MAADCSSNNTPEIVTATPARRRARVAGAASASSHWPRWRRCAGVSLAGTLGWLTSLSEDIAADRNCKSPSHGCGLDSLTHPSVAALIWINAPGAAGADHPLCSY